MGETMTTNVASLAVYRQLARIEGISDRINALGIRLDDDLILTYAGLLREACKDMQRALQQEQRERLEEQLCGSIALMNNKKPAEH